ncbi:Pre-rRNA-processing protein ESF2 [Xylariomycetidae sp. FL0641]|nr:Pre-rRNA-processing protein ESF2 [Xylariomycetidae sp. FL0641]
MPPEKRNHFLEAEESDDDGSQGYDSEAEQIQKGGRSSKRRKFEDDASDEDGVPSEAEGNSDPEDDPESDDKRFSMNRLERSGDDDDAGGSKSESEPRFQLKDVSGPLTKKNLVATEKAVKKSGVVYISRVPPFMKIQKVRSLLEPYGKINRLYLAPEDPQARSRRIKQGGNKKKNFTEGWIEFVNKKDAKAAVDLLNGHTIGGPKRSYYRDDIWSLLYLKGFKWHNLTEQIASEAAERTSRMRAEISKSTKENKEFVRNIEKGKMLDGIQSKAAAKKSRDDEAPERAVDANPSDSKSLRKFKQSSAGRKEADKAPGEAQRVLSRLF